MSCPVLSCPVPSSRYEGILGPCVGQWHCESGSDRFDIITIIIIIIILSTATLASHPPTTPRWLNHWLNIPPSTATGTVREGHHHTLRRYHTPSRSINRTPSSSLVVYPLVQLVVHPLDQICYISTLFFWSIQLLIHPITHLITHPNTHAFYPYPRLLPVPTILEVIHYLDTIPIHPITCLTTTPSYTPSPHTLTPTPSTHTHAFYSYPPS